jgi:regulator of protease activity HflC (stomatin/prohibitin superfamily)
MLSFFYNGEKEEIFFGRIIGTIVALVVACILAFGSWTVVPADKVGVPVTLGSIGSTPSYGLTFKLPIVTSYIEFDKTTQRMKLQDETYTKDLQDATVKYSFTYKIVSEKACELYRNHGIGYEEKIIDPYLDDALKGVFGRWTATELVAHRDVVANQIEELLKKELPKGFFTDITVKLDDIRYSDAFEKGIEQKVLAEQEAQKTKNKTAQIEEESKQKVIQAKANADAAIAVAEGKAKAMDIEGAAIRRNSQYLDLKRIEVSQKMAESASGWKTVVMDGKSGVLLNVTEK